MGFFSTGLYAHMFQYFDISALSMYLEALFIFPSTFYTRHTACALLLLLLSFFLHRDGNVVKNQELHYKISSMSLCRYVTLYICILDSDCHTFYLTCVFM